MSKRAEQRALETYPIKEEWIGNQYGSFGDVNAEKRNIYAEGYKQAEEDLALTCEDIKLINNILFDLYFEGWKTDSEEQSQARYQEALCRFNEKRKEQ